MLVQGLLSSGFLSEHPNKPIIVPLILFSS